MLNPGSIGSFKGFKAHEFVAHTGKTNCVAVGPRSGQVLATGGDDKRVNVWRIGRASSIWSLTGNSSGIESLCFDPTEEFLVSGSAGGAVKLFDLSAGKMTRHFRGHMSNVTVIDCGSFDRRFVTTGSMDCQVKLWNVETKECAMGFKGHNAEVTDVQFSPDGYILASAAADGQVKLWDLRAGKPMHTFQACSGPVRALRFNPQEFLLAASTSDRTVKLYDIEFMELFCVTAADTCPTRAITYDPDGQSLYCASPSGLRRWSWDNDTASARLEAMGEVSWGKVGAGALHYNADGRQLLAASCSGSRVSVWAVDLEDDPSTRCPQQHEPGGSSSSATLSGGTRGAGMSRSPTEPSSAAAVTPSRNSASSISVSSAGNSSNAEEGVEARTSSPGEQAQFRSGGAAVAGIETRIGEQGCSFEVVARRAATSGAGGGKESDLGKGYDDAGAKCSSRPTGESRSRDESRVERFQDSKGNGAKQRGESPGDAPTFQVLGRHLFPSTAADEKSPTPTGSSSAAPAAPAATVAVATPIVPGAGPPRRSSRAAAVAATVAAVASAKAATDDAVASVSSSGRHRSIGTSISDTLVISSASGGGGGRGEGGGRGGEGGVISRDGDRSVWPDPAPGKEDGSDIVGKRDKTRAGTDGGHKWHKRVTGAYAGGGADDKTASARGGSSGSRGVGRSEGGGLAKEVPGGLVAAAATKVAAAAAAAAAAGDNSRFPSNFGAIRPWLDDPRAGEVSLAALHVGGKGEGEGDSPPLLASPGCSPPLHRHDPPPPSSSRQRPPDDSREGPAEVAPRGSVVGFPVGGGSYTALAAGTAARNFSSPPAPAPAPAPGIVSGVSGRGHTLEGARGGDGRIGDDVGDGRGGDDGDYCGDRELGMTRPRTATRRWDRPGPPGEDEVIAKTLLSRAGVTSTLSNRLTHLRLLRSGWADGDIPGTISRLKRLERSVTPADASPRAVVADFLWVVPLEGARVTLDHCLELMPLLEDMWKLDSDGSVAAGTRCLESVVLRFGGFVRDTLGAPVSAGRVDLAREDRVERCREAHRAFIRGYHHLERAEREFYEDRRIAAVAERLRPLFESYFMS